MKLSEAQQRALGKLTGKWQNAYKLGESIATLGCLVRKGLADRKSGPGASWCPQVGISYRLKTGGGR